MNEIIQLAYRPEYIHVLLSHFPVLGVGLALVVLFAGLISENRSLTLAGLLMQGVLSGLTLLVVASGESAYEHLKAAVDTETAILLEAHAMAASQWSVLYYITAFVSLAAAVVAWKYPRRMWLPSAVAAICATLSLVGGVNVAHSGGKIRHPEFRAPPKPTSQYGPGY